MPLGPFTKCTIYRIPVLVEEFRYIPPATSGGAVAQTEANDSPRKGDECDARAAQRACCVVRQPRQRSRQAGGEQHYYQTSCESGCGLAERHGLMSFGGVALYAEHSCDCLGSSHRD
jgi:hypothetical protein